MMIITKVECMIEDGVELIFIGLLGVIILIENYRIKELEDKVDSLESRSKND